MATLATNVSFQCFGPDGKPLAGGKVYTYEAGTTTPKITYTNMQGDVPNPNPVTLDQNGKAKIFLADGNYRLRALDNNDALVDDIDQISRYVTQSEFAVFQQGVNDGVSQLTEIREQIDVFVGTAIISQKGFMGGIAPLDGNAKIPHIYLPDIVSNTSTNDPNKILSAAAGLDLQQQITNAYGQQFGAGQSWQNVTGIRTNDVNYTNSTGRPIAVFVEFRVTTGEVVILSAKASVNSVVAASSSTYSASMAYRVGLSFIVPSGAGYSVNNLSNAEINAWSELRS